jgi:soluble lytic murein transglycosylase
MQLMPDTAAEMALKEGLLDYSTSLVEEPDINIRLGTAYLAELTARFSTLEEALAAYNAGPTVVRTWREQGSGIPFEETRAYVENVKRHKAALQRLYPDWESPSR